MSAKIEMLIEQRRLSLLDKLVMKMPAECVERYHQWREDDAGCNLSGFMDEKYHAQYGELDALCELLEDCENMQAELNDLKRNAHVGRLVRQLINSAM